MKKGLFVLAVVVVIMSILLLISCGGGGGTSTNPPASNTAPTVTTNSVTVGSDGTTATVNYTVGSNLTVTGGGVCVGDTETTMTNCTPAGEVGTGNFSVQIAVTPGQLKYVTGYAVNSAGTSTADPKEASTLWYVSSITGKIDISDVDGKVFVETREQSQEEGQDIKLTAFYNSGTTFKTSSVLVTSTYDTCRGIVHLDGFVYMLCVQSPYVDIGGTGVVTLRKINAETGEVTIFAVSNNGTALGIAADKNAKVIYVCYSSVGVSNIVGFHTNGTVLGYTSSNEVTGQFAGIMIVDDNAIYTISHVTQTGSRDRIKIIKYSKNFGVMLGSVQYRDFTVSVFPDSARSAALYGSNLFVAVELDNSSSSQRGALLKINASSMSLTVINDNTWIYENLVFDASGNLYGTFKDTSSVPYKMKVGKIDPATGTTLWAKTIKGGIDMTVNGNVLYVSNAESSKIQLVDTATGALLN